MSAPQRILVVRLDRIGDVVLSLPVAQALRLDEDGGLVVR